MHLRTLWALVAITQLIVPALCQDRAPAVPTAGFSGLNASHVAETSRQVHSTSTSWLWVNCGVATQVAGSFADWATSWKQPERNQLLAESSGPYQGRFYRQGTIRKIGLSAGVAAVSYMIALKWPKTRKYVGIFNMSFGAGYGAAAISNVIRNPYYK